jgi:hypothetical protein
MKETLSIAGIIIFGLAALFCLTFTFSYITPRHKKTVIDSLVTGEWWKDKANIKSIKVTGLPVVPTYCKSRGHVYIEGSDFTEVRDSSFRSVFDSTDIVYVNYMNVRHMKFTCDRCHLRIHTADTSQIKRYVFWSKCKDTVETVYDYHGTPFPAVTFKEFVFVKCK